jgi:hypothetical protein
LFCGGFCTGCGAELTAKAGTWRSVLRPRVFAAAPRERVWWPLIVTTMFPRLVESLRLPFRHALFLLVANLLVLSMLRLLAPVVILTALGFPLLFLVYVWRSGALNRISNWALAISCGLGIASSVAWWLWTSRQVAAAYGVPLAVGAQLTTSLDIGLVITLAGAVLMVLPAVAVRLLRVPVPECLDGFVIGALGALLFSAAGTITWFAPQFIAGLINNYRPWRLFEEAYLYGFVDSVTAAAAGGLVGLALWFHPRMDGGVSARRSRLALVLMAVLGVGLYMAVYVVDAAALQREVELAAITIVTIVSLVTVRVGVQLALLHEQPDPAVDQSVMCGQCRRVVPDTPFCPECGAAKQASPISLRGVRVG